MKRFATILLALVMILSLTIPAFAAGSDSITIKNAQPGETYKLYKLFDLSVNEGLDAYTYTVNADWAAFFAAGEGETPAGAGRQYVTIDDNGYVTAISDAAALAKAAAEWAGKPAAIQTVTVAADANVAEFTGLQNGYWLITSTLGTVAMTDTTPADPAVEITEKNREDSIKKEVKEDSTGNYGASNDAQIGDTVEFKSTITLVPGTRNVVVHDTMDNGLTLTVDSIKIDGLTVGSDYNVVTEGLTDGCTFEVRFTDAYISGLKADTTLILTYSAVLNANVIGEDTIVAQKNVTKITYGDAQSVTSQTTTTTHKFTVDKWAEGVEHLAGAVFSLKKDSKVVPLIMIDATNYRVAMPGEEGAQNTFATVADDVITIWGVDSDKYTLEETVAPAGYNLLADEVEVTVGADNATVAKIENQSGSELPSTGGMGTTMFYLFGGILVLASVVLLVTKKRMTNMQ